MAELCPGELGFIPSSVNFLRSDKNGHIKYLNTTGPTSLSYNYQQLSGHDHQYHTAGFGSPVGKLKNIEYTHNHIIQN